MKLAVIVDTFPRWSERFIARECRELLRQGIDLSIFCLKAGPTPPPDEHEWEGLLERRIVLPVCLVPSLRSEAHLPAGVRDRRARVRAALGATAYTKVRCAEALQDILRADGFTHVHAHFASLPSTLGWLASQELGLPFTFSVHARDLFVDAQLLAEKSKDARAIFCCHEHAHQYLQAAATPGKAILMHHGVPLDAFPFRTREAVRGRPWRLLAAGRFVEKKGFLQLLAALAQPELRALEWAADFVGEGPLRSKLASAIRRLKLESRVTLRPPVSGAALRDCLDGADLFLAPYTSGADGDIDGIPNSVLEAFALGLPVLATRAGGMGAVVATETATVLDALEPAVLAAEIAAVLKNPGELRLRAQRARQRVEDSFDLKTAVLPLLNVLKQS